MAALDQLHRELVQLLEVVGCEEETVLPIETQPAHVGLDGLDVLRVLDARIRVVEPQVAGSTFVLSWAMPKLRQIDFACPMWR